MTSASFLSPTPAPCAPAGLVTFLFTDIEGSTLLLQQLGQEYGALLEAHHQILREASAPDGYEFSTQGDSMCIAFANARDALAAAVHMQRDLSTPICTQGVRVRVRMALHSGEPTLAGGDYFGLDVHRAARLCNAAHGGQVLVSQRTRELLGEVADPGVALRELGRHRLKDLPVEEMIYQLDITGLPDEFPPIRSLQTHFHNLPQEPTAFLGREKETAFAHQLLSRKDVRLLTLTGMGGIGKTRLALHIARKHGGQWRDGVCFVPLAAARDSTQVADAIAEALDVRKNPEQPVSQTLQTFLRPKQILLVLDNFEQVVGAALLIADLLASCADLKILLTSRAPLHLRGEHEMPVPPLPIPDLQDLPPLEELERTASVALFVQRVRASQPDYELTPENAGAVAEICARLEGLALAIELAAARVKSLRAVGVLARLNGELGNNPLQLLTGQAPDAPARHQTMRAAISWSHDLLSPSEQILFRRLAVFVQGCNIEAAEAIACNPSAEAAPDVFDLLTSLADKSLLRQSERGGQTRFAFLESVRHFALERLRESGEEESVRQSHAAYFCALARHAQPHLLGAGDVAAWMERLETDDANGSAAMEWLLKNDPHRALELACDVAVYLSLAGRNVESRDSLERALEHAPDAPLSIRAVALREMGDAYLRLEDFPRAVQCLEESIALSRHAGIKRNLARALRSLGGVERGQDNPARARELIDESVAIERTHGDKRSIAAALQYAGSVACDMGELERAQILYEESAALFQAAGHTNGVACTAVHLAAIAYLRGDREGARFHTQSSLHAFRENHDKGNAMWALRYLSTLALEQGDIEGADALYGEYLQCARELNDHQARIRALWGLARVAHTQGHFVRAQNWLRQALALSRENGDDQPICALIEALAQSCATTQPERAAILFGAVGVMCQSDKTTLPPYLTIPHEKCLQQLIAALGEEVFENAQARGRALSLGQLVVFAFTE